MALASSRTGSLTSGLVAALLLLDPGGGASAQSPAADKAQVDRTSATPRKGGTGAPAPKPAPKVAVVTNAAPTPLVESSVSFAEMIAAGDDARMSMLETVTRLTFQIEAARKARDIIRLTCLVDKVNQIKANIAIADNALAVMGSIPTVGSDDSRMLQFSRLTAAKQKAEMLAAESEECVGADFASVQRPRLEVTVTGNLPDDSVTQPTNPTPIAERPPSASPYF